MHRITRRARLGSLWLFTVLLGLFAAPLASAATKNTTFVPATHGFNFSNSFNNDVIKDLDIRTGGLCGGMVYAALDYYNTGVAVPRQDYRPAASTPLQRYLYGRQVDSLPPNITKWAEVGINPGGARNAEFFNWGLTSELANLRALIDAGKPAPLGLHGVTGTTHQVLAVGYDTDAAGKLVEIRLNATIHFRDGTTQQVDNINARKKWGDNAVQTVMLTLGHTRARADIVGLTLTTTFGGGMGGDNWNVDSLEVAPVIGSNTASAYVRRTGKPLKRFTGSEKSLKVTW
jgi:hypothetical protein